MNQWIKIEGEGYVNLAHVMRAEPLKEEDGGWECYSLTLADGSHVKTVGNERFESLISTILPAQPGQEAVEVHCDRVTRPTTLRIRRYPIIGWRLFPKCPRDPPTPVLPISGPDREVMIVLPDGCILSRGREREYKNLDDMRREVLLEEQQQWDDWNQENEA